MTRKRKTENEVVVSPAGAVPSRRKSTARRPHAPVTERETAATSAEAPAAVYEPTREEIALQAYLYWEQRGYQGGSSEEDWLRAEQELKAGAVKAATA